MPLPSSPQSFLRRAPTSLSSSDSPPPFLSASVELQPCKSPFITKSCSCTPNKRRRYLPSGTSRSSRRNRHCSRMDCPVFAFQSSFAFDRLPWISVMDDTPDESDPWNIADLSQLPIEDDISPLGPGPIRRRKTSLRSNPFPQNNQSSAEPPPSSPPSRPMPSSPFPSHSLSLRDPRTPPRDPIPQHQIRFHNLLPLPPYFD